MESDQCTYLNSRSEVAVEVMGWDGQVNGKKHEVTNFLTDSRSSGTRISQIGDGSQRQRRSV